MVLTPPISKEFITLIDLFKKENFGLSNKVCLSKRNFVVQLHSTAAIRIKRTAATGLREQLNIYHL